MRTLMMTIRAEGHDTYSALKDHLGASCCDEADCHPAHYRITSVQAGEPGSVIGEPSRRSKDCWAPAVPILCMPAILITRSPIH
jgi:hypothetical protein